MVEFESAASSSSENSRVRVKKVEFLLEIRLFSLEFEAADSNSTTLPSDTLIDHWSRSFPDHFINKRNYLVSSSKVGHNTSLFLSHNPSVPFV